jgi:hypothetical protein
MEQFKEIYKRNMLVNQLLSEQLTSQITVSDTEIQSYYEGNKKMFEVPDQVRASHILVETEDEAKAIIKELKDGADFEELAGSKSIDPTAKTNGGELGFFSQGKMVAEFETAAFALKIGEISAPVKTQFGYHVIKVTDKKAAYTMSLDTVKDQIEEALKAEKQKSVIDTYVSQLRASAEIDYVEGDALRKAEGRTFIKTEDAMCTQMGKPIIRMYGKEANCASCEWMGSGFDAVVNDYVGLDMIVAHHWQLDTGDDTMTAEVEKGLPSEEVEIFKKYSPQGKLPLYVFGCTYVRTANAYEAENNLEAEQNEFKAIIEELVASS